MTPSIQVSEEMIEALTDSEAEAALVALVSMFDGLECCPAALVRSKLPGPIGDDVRERVLETLHFVRGLIRVDGVCHGEMLAARRKIDAVIAVMSPTTTRR